MKNQEKTVVNSEIQEYTKIIPQQLVLYNKN